MLFSSMAKQQIGTRAENDDALATMQETVNIIKRDDALTEVIAGDRTKRANGWAAPHTIAAEIKRARLRMWQQGAITTAHQVA